MNGYIPKKISIAGLIFYFLLIILAVFVISHFAELKNIADLFKKIKPIWFILAVIFQLLTYRFAAEVYYKILNLYNHRFSIKRSDLFQVSIISLFLSQLIPLGGLSGGSYLMHYFQKRKVPARESFAVVILETFAYNFCHILLLLFSFFYIAAVLERKTYGALLWIVILGIFLFFLLSATILFFSRKRTIISISDIISKHKWLKKIFKRIIPFDFPGKEVLEGGWEDPWQLVKNNFHYLWRPIFWQLMVFLADATTITLLFGGFNSRVNFLTVIVGMVLTKAVALVAIFSPGALVIFEGAMVFFYSSFGIPLNLALVVTLMFRALSFWLPMPFGLALYKHLNTANNQE